MARKMTLDRVGELMQGMLAELQLAGGTARRKELFARFINCHDMLNERGT